MRLAGLEFGGPPGVGVSPKEAPSPAKPIVDLTVVVDGLRVEKAFADGTALDVSKPFYPLGQQTQPGSTFYLENDEVFEKPNASVRAFMARTKSPPWPPTQARPISSGILPWPRLACGRIEE